MLSALSASPGGAASLEADSMASYNTEDGSYDNLSYDRDDFEVFCALARATPPRSSLTVCGRSPRELSGSMPSLDVHSPAAAGAGGGGNGWAPRDFSAGGYGGQGDGFLAVPLSPHVPRRSRSAEPDFDHGGGGGGSVGSSRASSRASSRCSSRGSSRASSPGGTTGRMLSPNSRLSPSHLWSSFKSLVEACEHPQCVSPTDDDDDDDDGGRHRRALRVPPKCPSAPHSRSPSVKKRRGSRGVSGGGSAARRRSSGGGGLTARPRTNSLPIKSIFDQPLLPHPDASGETWCRVRNFVSTPKGIINCGDSFQSTWSDSSVKSGGSDAGGWGMSALRRGGAESPGLPPPLVGDSEEPAHHHVHILGSVGVGKTTLAQQFLTSECLVNAADNGGGDSGGTEFEDHTTVSVLLDNALASLHITEVPFGQDSRGCGGGDAADAYLVVFSTSDRASFHHAIALLCKLRGSGHGSGGGGGSGAHKAIVLVANKTDLVRARQVAEQEGRCAAETASCKYIEVSALMNLAVDDLLGGLLNQIRLRQTQTPGGDPAAPGDPADCGSGGESGGGVWESQRAADAERSRRWRRPRSPIVLIGRLLNRTNHYSKSCENMMVI